MILKVVRYRGKTNRMVLAEEGIHQFKIWLKLIGEKEKGMFLVETI